MHGYTYADALEASEKINWRVEDLIGGDKKRDFAKPYLPESLARVTPLAFLTADEGLALNQIRGLGYLYLFGLVEEFILPFVLDHARPQLHGDDVRVRALLEFASEEAKHIQLFRQFRQEFKAGFGSTCELIGPAAEIGRAVLTHEPLAVALAILHIEWMTQRHWIESTKDDQALDPQFKSLLRHHWMEEAQHAKLDTLMVEALAAGRTAEEIDRAVDGYLDIGGMLDAGVGQQVTLDLESFTRATRRRLNDAEAKRYQEVQLAANRWTYLGSGMSHPQVLNTLGTLSPAARQRIEQIAPAFC